MEGENIVSGPPIPSILLCNTNKSLSQFVMNVTRNQEPSIVMIDAETDDKLYSEEVLKDSLVLAAKLKMLGCKPGIVIGIICENRREYAAIMLASFHIGSILSAFNPAYSLGELEHTMNITRPYLIFTNADCYPKIVKINEKLKCIQHFVSLDDRLKGRKIVNYKTLINNVEPKYVPPNISGDSTALILFSSGSTGLPKGVMLSNRSLVILLEIARFHQYLTQSKRDRTLSVIPTFHGYGVMVLLSSLVQGDTIISLKKFQEEKFLSSIPKYKVSALALVPPLMIFMAKHPLVDKYDLSSITSISCGAAPLSPAIEKTVIDKFGLTQIQKGYGMTETTIVCTLNLFSDSAKLFTVGKLVPGMIAKVIDLETGEPLGPNKEGEICFKGIYLMQGYYNNKEETDKAIDSDGWLHTGDVGYYDEDEDFYIVDRIKDLIKYKGYQVAPAELEALLIKHEAIKDAAVIGIPHDIAGEVPKAFVVKRGNISEQEIVDYVSDHVAPHMKLRGGVAFINEIPRNPNGKILRKNLRTWLQSKL